MSQRQNISSGTKWEDIAGYSRAVRIGNLVYISGTTATDANGDIVGPNDPYKQTVFIIQKIERALHEAGASLDDVVRTRIFVTNASQWEAVARAHAAFFRDIRPANTLVEISALIGEGYVVEMEADAVIQDDRP
jgi:enamine deaminase RidA (YjgF/YER057c/UK114 family)